MIHATGGAPFWVLVGTWWAMMAVMMLPVTWPWIRALHRLSAPPAGAAGASPRAARLPSTVIPAFAVGYLIVWFGFSLGAAGLQRVLLPSGGAHPTLHAAVLLAAGLYQLTPLKEACLDHCRSPLGVLLARWPLAGGGALRMGLEHGLFCLGCCWALMLLGLGAGAAAWVWILALVLLVAVEKLTPPGPRVARGAGIALLALGLLVATGYV